MARGVYLSAGALTVIILGGLAAFMAFAMWLYKAFKRNREYKKEYKAALDSMDETTGSISSRSKLHPGPNLSGYNSGGNTNWGLSDSSESSRRGSRISQTGTPESDVISRYMDMSPGQASTDEPMGDFGSVSVAISYNENLSQLIVLVDNCTDLMPLDKHVNLADTSILLELFPVKQVRHKTNVVKGTTSPVFKEQFIFEHVTEWNLKDAKLHLVVLAYDRYSRENIVGDVVISLHDLDLPLNYQVSLSKPIQPRSAMADHCASKPEVLLGLSYYPDISQISVAIMKAKHLPRCPQSGVVGDPFVLVKLRYNNQSQQKKTTKMKAQTLRPVYNEVLTFNISEKIQLDVLPRVVSFEVLVMIRKQASTRNGDAAYICLAYLELGLNCGGEVMRHHWLDIFKQPGKQLANWHELKINTDDSGR